MVKKTSYYRAFNASFYFTSSQFILFCTLIVFIFTGEVKIFALLIMLPKHYSYKILTAEKAFLCLSMFNLVRLSMTLFFPMSISQLGETRVSVKRIQDFLLLEEREEQAGERSTSTHDDHNKDTVTMEDVTGRWSKEEKQDTIASINLTAKPGQLLAVIGPVGSGKVWPCYEKECF